MNTETELVDRVYKHYTKKGLGCQKRDQNQRQNC